MDTTEYEPYFSVIHDACLYFEGSPGNTEEEIKRIRNNLDKVHAALDIPQPLSDDRFRNRLSTLDIVCEVISNGETPPELGRKALETFIKNYERLNNPD